MMEFWIAFTVTFIVGSFIKLGKKQKKNNLSKPASAKNNIAPTEHQQKLKQADEELITVVLPTINNDK